MNVYIHLIRRLGYIGRIGLIFTAFSVGAQDAAKVLEASGVKGGLVVVLGAENAPFLADLQAAGPYVVQALETDAVKVAKARQTLQDMGVYGPVSVVEWNGDALPYTDNLVNLVLVASVECSSFAKASADKRVSGEEIERVLAPGGVSVIINQQSSISNPFTKPRPAEIDDWTHFLHSPNNNAVSKDRAVAPPKNLQWIDGPAHSRHHDHMSSVSAAVSAGGRVFVIADEGSTASILLPPHWTLTARDAFNGVFLWKKPIKRWFDSLFPLKHGPIVLTRRLVAVDHNVYVTLGADAPVSRLDAADGRVLETYAQTEHAEEILVEGDTLVVSVAVETNAPLYDDLFGARLFEPGQRRHYGRILKGIDLSTGALRWQHTTPVAPLSPAIAQNRLYYHDGMHINCADLRSGRQIWRTENPAPASYKTSYGASLVVKDGIVLFSGDNRDGKFEHGGYGWDNTLFAFHAETGKALWQAYHPASAYESTEDVLVIDGVVWYGATFGDSHQKERGSGQITGLDIQTGEIVKQFNPDTDTYFFHHRCYTGKATERYLLFARNGTEFVDPKTEHWQVNHWVRGPCIYGIMPANGLLYAGPDPCACNHLAKLNGWLALTGDAFSIPESTPEARLRKGPAFAHGRRSEDGSRTSDSAFKTSDAWPTFRGDPARTCSTDQELSTHWKPVWTSRQDTKLGAPVVSDGLVIVPAPDRHTVIALDADTGKAVWRFTAGGRVDSPPTLWKGHAYFGCADGWIYALDAADGQPIWKYRAAPIDRRLMSYGQVESFWPLHGSVLIRVGAVGDELWCVAGRSRFLQGGLRLLRLQADTGALISETVLDERVYGTDETLTDRVNNLNMGTALPDILSSDERYVYMRNQHFQLDGRPGELVVPPSISKDQTEPIRHVFCPTGFLDDTLWHRTYLLYGTEFSACAGGYFMTGRYAPGGCALAIDDEHVYAYARKSSYYRWTTPLEYVLYRAEKDFHTVECPEFDPEGKAHPKKGYRGCPRPFVKVKRDWEQPLPMTVRSILLSRDKIFTAGPPDFLNEAQAVKTIRTEETQWQVMKQERALAGKEGGWLIVSLKETGEELFRMKLSAPPVLNGMAAADGKLYIALTDGQVVCLGK